MRRGRRGRGRAGKRTATNEQGARQGPSGLIGSLAADVENQVRQRGEAYFRQGRVIDPKATPERISAEVRGKGGSYHVTIDMAFDTQRNRSSVAAVCDCPYFNESRGYCKHIWAVICLADRTPACEFKAPVNHPVSFRTRLMPAPQRRLPAVVSVDPGAAGRIRAFSAGDHAAAPAPKEPEPRSHRGNNNQPSWRDALRQVGHAQRDISDARQRLAAPSLATDVHYVVDADATRKSGKLTVQVFRLTPGADAGPSQLTAAPVDLRALESFAEGPDREILTWFFGVAASSIVRTGAWDEGVVPLRARGNAFVVADNLRASLLARMAATGRFGWLAVDDAKLEGSGPFDLESFRPLAWEGGDPWHFRLAVSVRKQDRGWAVRGEFRRGGQTVPLSDTLVTFADGMALFKDRVVTVDMPDPRANGWMSTLRQLGNVRVDKADQAAFLRTLTDMASSPPIDLPGDSGFSVVTGEPKPKLIFLAKPIAEKAMVLMANYEFDYEAPVAAPQAARGRGRGRGGLKNAPPPAAGEQPQAQLAEGAQEGAPPPPKAAPPPEPQRPRVVLRRDRDREETLVRDLCTHPGVQPSAGRGATGADLFVDASALAELVSDLSSRGWAVEAEGQKLRAGKSFNVDVKTGVDWLDLKASFDFGDTTVDLPRILEAVRRGDDRVQLGDGTVGLLPETWLKKLEPILKMGEDQGEDSLRYRASHAAFLDVLVSEAKEANLDASFTAYRKKLASFSGISETAPDEEFVGELRPYQRQGLGWLEFLDEFAFGGCLADDMGLGKTVQVLAHLQKRRHAADGDKKRLPTLIVAPTSLIHNWKDEASRFVPDLKVCPHLGASRPDSAKELAAFDLVVTSYGTMRSDIDLLSAMKFDYVILDEAQSIKNESTQVAKAARLLNGHRRLAMSGTPVENRLSELGSIFRFLNPGMLDTAAGFADLFTGSGKLTQGKLETLAKALRPFILRRTKEQVLPDLPGKTEITAYCVLEDDQRREYDELAAHYRDTLKKKVKSVGLGKSRMHVLEALLRLRQLACHPGLIDEKRLGEASAKLDLLEEQLEEALDSGRKALVFSQFTSMLAIVKQRLDEKGIVYEYLDGSTVNRKQRVEHFQTNPDVKVFLISLKAGGVGLNLTAADYCFILDPWWNPASEAQAIDRAHRIGQTSHVFAYRLIARGTVEEKILQLQAEKRKLADGIIADDGDALTDLTAKDLDFLLG